HVCLLFYFNDPAPTEFYTLSLHDALPICRKRREPRRRRRTVARRRARPRYLCVHCRRHGNRRRRRGERRAVSRPPLHGGRNRARSEEHTSELQSLAYLVCRPLLEKKKIYK